MPRPRPQPTETPVVPPRPERTAARRKVTPATRCPGGGCPLRAFSRVRGCRRFRHAFCLPPLAMSKPELKIVVVESGRAAPHALNREGAPGRPHDRHVFCCGDNESLDQFETRVVSRVSFLRTRAAIRRVSYIIDPGDDHSREASSDTHETRTRLLVELTRMLHDESDLVIVAPHQSVDLIPFCRWLPPEPPSTRACPRAPNSLPNAPARGRTPTRAAPKPV